MRFNKSKSNKLYHQTKMTWMYKSSIIVYTVNILLGQSFLDSNRMHFFMMKTKDKILSHPIYKNYFYVSSMNLSLRILLAYS